MIKLLGVTLSAKAVTLVILFTAVEIVTLVVWLILAATPQALAVSPGRALAAIIVLAVGLLIEHFLSAVAGHS